MSSSIVKMIFGFTVLIFNFSSFAFAQKEVLIPRSMEGDKGRYYLIESKKVGDIKQSLHKRVGVDSVGYTRTETNCKTMQMRVIGYGEQTVENIKPSPTKWFDLVAGSSKSDLANFVCRV